jgi:hypothetical protein
VDYFGLADGGRARAAQKELSDHPERKRRFEKLEERPGEEPGINFSFDKYVG